MALCSPASESLFWCLRYVWVSRIIGLHWHNRRRRVVGPPREADLSDYGSLEADLIFSLLNKKRSHPFSCLSFLSDCGITSGELTPSLPLLTLTAVSCLSRGTYLFSFTFYSILSTRGPVCHHPLWDPAGEGHPVRCACQYPGADGHGKEKANGPYKGGAIWPTRY